MTDWNAYGRRSGNPKCRDCMVHCGYEPTAVRETFSSLGGFLKTARLTVIGPSRVSDQQLNRVSERQLAAAANVERKAHLDPAGPPRQVIYELPVLSDRL